MAACKARILHGFIHHRLGLVGRYGFRSDHERAGPPVVPSSAVLCEERHELEWDKAHESSDGDSHTCGLRAVEGDDSCPCDQFRKGFLPERLAQEVVDKGADVAYDESYRRIAEMQPERSIGRAQHGNEEPHQKPDRKRVEKAVDQPLIPRGHITGLNGLIGHKAFTPLKET